MTFLVQTLKHHVSEVLLVAWFLCQDFKYPRMALISCCHISPAECWDYRHAPPHPVHTVLVKKSQVYARLTSVSNDDISEKIVQLVFVHDAPSS